MEWITLPGIASYHDTMIMMEERVNQIINKEACEVVYLLEYNNIYTAGTSAKSSELLNLSKEAVISTNRGGKITFHGLGQRVIYPIINLSSEKRQKDLKLYIKMLEQWIINSLRCFGVLAYVVDGRVGVWVNHGVAESKIAAIGVRIKRWVAYHGIGVNISTDLTKFSNIIPCGLADSSVTSLKEIKINISMAEFDQVIEREFYKIF